MGEVLWTCGGRNCCEWMKQSSCSAMTEIIWLQKRATTAEEEGEKERAHQSNITYCAQISITFSPEFPSAALCFSSNLIHPPHCTMEAEFPRANITARRHHFNIKRWISLPHRNPFNRSSFARSWWLLPVCSFVAPYYSCHQQQDLQFHQHHSSATRTHSIPPSLPRPTLCHQLISAILLPLLPFQLTNEMNPGAQWDNWM